MGTEALTITGLIAKWPSLKDFATATGIPYETAKQMRRRSSIGVGYWPQIIRAAELHGVEGVTPETLMAMNLVDADEVAK